MVFIQWEMIFSSITLRQPQHLPLRSLEGAHTGRVTCARVSNTTNPLEKFIKYLMKLTIHTYHSQKFNFKFNPQLKIKKGKI